MTRTVVLLALGMMGCTGAQSALEGRLAGLEMSFLQAIQNAAHVTI